MLKKLNNFINQLKICKVEVFVFEDSIRVDFSACIFLGWGAARFYGFFGH